MKNKQLPSGVSLRPNNSYLITCRINGKRVTKTVPFLKQALIILEQFHTLKERIEKNVDRK
jgi:hypothetical protein